MVITKRKVITLKAVPAFVNINEYGSKPRINAANCLNSFSFIKITKKYKIENKYNILIDILVINKNPNKIIKVFNNSGKIENSRKINIGKSLLLMPCISETDPLISE